MKNDLKKHAMENNFKEGNFTNFAPTFKIKPENDIYSPKRNPAWTDRILYKGDAKVVQLMNYDSNNLLKMSDHRPVFAQFEFDMGFMHKNQTPHDKIVSDMKAKEDNFDK